MPTKRVALNISLPDEEFKAAVLATAEQRGKSPSEEFVELYKRLRKKR